MSDRIDCTARILIPTSLAMLHFASYASKVSPPITHNQYVHDVDIFISGASNGGGGRPSIILNVLLPHLLNSAAHVYTVLYKVDSFPRLSMKSLNFLGRHSFLTEVFGNCSDFNFLHFANMSHPPFLKSDLHSQCPSNRSNEGLITLLRQ